MKASASPAFRDGHFYSPVVSVAEATRRAEKIWTEEFESAGIDYAPEAQRRFIAEDLAKYLPDFDYPQASADKSIFYEGNPAFSWLDSRALFTMLRKYTPARMVEVGSGYSSFLTADVNMRFLNGALDFTCIEPYPMESLRRGRPGITRLIDSLVQDVDLGVFRKLGPDDILFIDSSHVSKTGGDVNHLIFKVLPILQPGVIVHFHDIFLPREYPKTWILNNGFSWNEQYLVQALLMGSTVFEVIFGSAYALYHFAEELKTVLNGRVFGGGSLWIRKARHFLNA